MDTAAGGSTERNQTLPHRPLPRREQGSYGHRVPQRQPGLVGKPQPLSSPSPPFLASELGGSSCPRPWKTRK